MEHKLTRRSLLKYFAAICVSATRLPIVDIAKGQVYQAPSLKAAAQRSGKLVAMFSGQGQLMTDPIAARIIAAEFDMLATGNDLKMNRIHPKPDTYDFSYGDWDLDWSKRNGLLFRGHTLVWHNVLPTWFRSYVNKENAQRVMTDHITTVVKHYAGNLYSWDVVNEPIHNDGRADGLRVKPWLELVGPDYIEIAFRTAAAADPKAKLMLNECFIEHDLPAHTQRRDALLQLAIRLKNKNVPITGVGIQGHIKADIPLATSSLKNLLTALQDLGLEIMITELDVDDSHVPNAVRDEVVAQRFAEYLELVGPFARVITFQTLADPAKNQGQEFDFPGRADGLTHRPDLFDTSYQKKLSYYAAIKTLAHLGK